MVMLGSKLYFAMTEDDVTARLWMTDGTEAGTVVVSNSHTEIRDLTVKGDELFFSAVKNGSRSLHVLRNDGTTIDDLGVPFARAPYVGPGGLVYVEGYAAGTSGSELYVTDGTSVGTLVDIRPGTPGSNPGEWLTAGSTLLFVATGPTAGNELWTSDGTEAGTVLVADIWPGSSSSDVSPRLSLGNIALLTAFDDVAGEEVWASDGTGAGTVRLADIAPGTADATPRHFARLGDRALFAAQSGASLWGTEGTPATTTRVLDLPAGATIERYLGASPGRQCYKVYSAANGYEPWCTDGTAAGTLQLVDLCPGSCDGLQSGS